MKTFEIAITGLNFFLIIFAPSYALLTRRGLSLKKVFVISASLGIYSVIVYFTKSEKRSIDQFQETLKTSIEKSLKGEWDETTKKKVTNLLPGLKLDDLAGFNKKFLLGMTAMSFAEKKEFFKLYNLAIFKNDNLCQIFSENESYINDEFILEIMRLDSNDYHRLVELIGNSTFLYFSMNIDINIRPIFPEGELKAMSSEQAVMTFAEEKNKNYDYSSLFNRNDLKKQNIEMCKFLKDTLTTIDYHDMNAQYAFIDTFLINNAVTKYSR